MKRLAVTLGLALMLVMAPACGSSSGGSGSTLGTYDVLVTSGYGGGLAIFRDVLSGASPRIGADVWISNAVARLNGRMHVADDMLAAASNDSNEGIYVWDGLSTLMTEQAPTVQVGSNWYYCVCLHDGDLYGARSSQVDVWRDVLTKANGAGPDFSLDLPGSSHYFVTVHDGRLYAGSGNPYEIHVWNDPPNVTGATPADAILPTADWVRRLYFDGGRMYQPLMSGGLIASWGNVASATTGTTPDMFHLSFLDEYICMTFGGGRAWLGEMWPGDQDAVFATFGIGQVEGTKGLDSETMYLQMTYELDYKDGILFGSAGESAAGIYWYEQAGDCLSGDPNGWALDPRIRIAKQMLVTRR